MPWNRLADGTLRMMTDPTLQIYFRGDMPIPQFFMSGDAHRTPPFAWTDAGSIIRAHFLDRLNKGRLCAHVEQLQAAVNRASIPAFLAPLIGQNRVFGWELPIFAPLARAGALYVNMALKLADNVVDREMLQYASQFADGVVTAQPFLAGVGNPVGLTGGLNLAERLCEYVVDVIANASANSNDTNAAFRTELRVYRDSIMELRTGAHPYMATPIQNVIDLYPTCVHIITCGDAHITDNHPLHGYIHLPNGAVGVVDGSRF